MITKNGATRATCRLALPLLLVALSGCRNAPPATAQEARTAVVIDSAVSAVAPSDTTPIPDTQSGVAERAGKPASAATVSGTLEPQARALLRAELPGVIRTLAVKVGERVGMGQVLATLDVPAVRSAMAAAEAQAVAQEAALRQVQRERDRVAQLLAAGGVSLAEMEDWDSRVQAADASLQAARAQRATAAADVARLTVRAPFDGIVERRTATAGSMVQVGDELVSIIDPRTLELDAGVAIAQAHLARPGHRVSLRVAGYPEAVVVARIVRVAPSLDPVTRQLRITIHVPNDSRRFPAGAWAEGSLWTDEAAVRPPSRIANGGR
jgi:RND family efflux transporter MFP subunit